MVRDSTNRGTRGNIPSRSGTADPYALEDLKSQHKRLLELRHELGRLRDEPLSEYEWQHLNWKYEGRVAEVSPLDLIDALDVIPAAAGHTPRPRRRDETEPTSNQSRVGALSMLMALEASQREDIFAWRQRALPDGLLGFYDDTFIAWLQERAATQSEEVELLPYAPASATYVQNIAVDRGSLLDDLRKLAAELAYTYRWQDATAVVFVLTGAAPIIPSIRSTVTTSNRSASASCIRLEIDPWTDPRRVAAEYQRLRSEAARGQHFRLPEQRALAVVEFVAGLHLGEPTQRALDAWNDAMKKRKQSAWRYDELKKFQRTYRDAAAKVQDPKII